MGRVRAAAAVIAIDTNVVVRFLTRDDPVQAARARSLIEKELILLPTAVVLETAWVLRRTYRYDHAAISTGIRHFIGLPGVRVEDAAAVARALDWYDRGLDFADALHLASSGKASAFATFDRALRRRARAISGIMPVIPP